MIPLPLGRCCRWLLCGLCHSRLKWRSRCLHCRESSYLQQTGGMFSTQPSDLLHVVVQQCCLSESLIFSLFHHAVVTLMIHEVPPCACSLPCQMGFFTKSIACRVDASHCRASGKADMDDKWKKCWAAGKRDKPSTAQGCDLSLMRMHQAGENNGAHGAP